MRSLLCSDGVGSQLGDLIERPATLAVGHLSIHFHSHLVTVVFVIPVPPPKGFATLQLPRFENQTLPHFYGLVFDVLTVEGCLGNVIWRRGSVDIVFFVIVEADP